MAVGANAAIVTGVVLTARAVTPCLPHFKGVVPLGQVVPPGTFRTFDVLTMQPVINPFVVALPAAYTAPPPITEPVKIEALTSMTIRERFTTHSL